jgi:1,4-alpha-glucan branching enzyme
VNFLQNHDQIGNRAEGERLTALSKPAALEAALSILLLSPSVPMLYMGEEWGATEPFPFFCDFKGELADAVRKGRMKEFSEAYAQSGDGIPDPLAESTRDLATLNWDELSKPLHAKRLALTRDLLRARQKFLVPLLPAITRGGEARLEDGVLTLKWETPEQSIYLLANLSDHDRSRPDDLPATSQVVWGDPSKSQLAPWSVFVAVGAR